MPTAQIPNLIPALPEIFMACVAMALLMLGVFQKSGADEEVRTARLISYLSVTTLGLVLLLVLTVSGERLVAFDGMFVVDPFVAFSRSWP